MADWKAVVWEMRRRDDGGEWSLHTELRSSICLCASVLPPYLTAQHVNSTSPISKGDDVTISVGIRLRGAGKRKLQCSALH